MMHRTIHIGDHEGMSSCTHMGLTLLNAGSIVVGLVMSIITIARVLGWGCDETDCQSMLYITTTFLSTKRIETNIGWPVTTERSSSDTVQSPLNVGNAVKDRNYRFSHFYECMYSARMADKVCSPDLAFSDYTTCINNSTIVSGLDYCASFPTINGYTHWPTSEEYLACLWNNPNLRNSEVRRASQNVFRSCIEKSLWPFFEVPQGIDSPIFFGSYNWALILVSGFVLMTSFGVYTAGFKEDGYVTRGEPNFLMRLGPVWSGIALVWNFVFLIIFVIIAFRGTGEFQKGGGLPTTASTTFVTLLAFSAGTLYFLHIFMQPTRRIFAMMRYHTGSNIATIVKLSENYDMNDHEKQHLLLKGTFPGIAPNGQKPATEIYKIEEKDVAAYYTPPMLETWADSYLADVLIVMGMAGATGQLSTDQAWNLFTFTLSYRFLNIIISRCMADTFTNNIRLDKDTQNARNAIVTIPHTWYNRRTMTGYEKKYMDVHVNTKVIGLSTQLAALYLFGGLLYIVFNPNSALKDFTVFSNFFILCFIIPEVLRLLIHLYYQATYEGDKDNGVPWGLYNSFYAVWIWDFVFRLIFVSVTILETANNPGTFDFLKTQSNALMRDYVLAMAS